MRPPEILVNLYLPSNPLFPQVLFALFLYGYRAMSCKPVINHPPAECFCDTEATMRRLVIRRGDRRFHRFAAGLECLRSDYLEVWTASSNAPLIRFAGAVRSIASTGLDLLGIAQPLPRLIDELRRFDSIVSWYGANRRSFASWCIRSICHSRSSPRCRRRARECMPRTSTWSR